MKNFFEWLRYEWNDAGDRDFNRIAYPIMFILILLITLLLVLATNGWLLVVLFVFYALYRIVRNLADFFLSEEEDDD